MSCCISECLEDPISARYGRRERCHGSAGRYWPAHRVTRYRAGGGCSCRCTPRDQAAGIRVLHSCMLEPEPLPYRRPACACAFGVRETRPQAPLYRGGGNLGKWNRRIRLQRLDPQSSERYTHVSYAWPRVPKNKTGCSFTPTANTPLHQPGIGGNEAAQPSWNL